MVQIEDLWVSAKLLFDAIDLGHVGSEESPVLNALDFRNFGSFQGLLEISLDPLELIARRIEVDDHAKILLVRCDLFCVCPVIWELDSWVTHVQDFKDSSLCLLKIETN